MPDEKRDDALSIKRRTQNEVMFREVNKAINQLNEKWEDITDTPSGLVCECDQILCGELLQVPTSEYERVRSDRTLFFVKVGHESGVDLERVVEQTAHFLVVQKRADDLIA